MLQRAAVSRGVISDISSINWSSARRVHGSWTSGCLHRRPLSFSYLRLVNLLVAPVDKMSFPHFVSLIQTSLDVCTSAAASKTNTLPPIMPPNKKCGLVGRWKVCGHSTVSTCWHSVCQNLQWRAVKGKKTEHILINGRYFHGLMLCLTKRKVQSDSRHVIIVEDQSLGK